MELSWCGRDTCQFDEKELREKVVGKHNEIMFDHPATGQVAYNWGHDDVFIPAVLILVKRNDDELLQVAADVSSKCLRLVAKSYVLKKIY